MVIFSKYFANILGKRYSQASDTALTHSPLYGVPVDVALDKNFWGPVKHTTDTKFTIARKIKERLQTAVHISQFRAIYACTMYSAKTIYLDKSAP